MYIHATAHTLTTPTGTVKVLITPNGTYIEVGPLLDIQGRHFQRIAGALLFEAEALAHYNKPAPEESSDSSATE